jgi:hypothetical protein
MDLLTVALDLHCYECGRDVHLEYEPPAAVTNGGARPVSARFSCPHCTHENEIDLPGQIIVARKPASPVALSH